MSKPPRDSGFQFATPPNRKGGEMENLYTMYKKDGEEVLEKVPVLRPEILYNRPKEISDLDKWRTKIVHHLISNEWDMMKGPIERISLIGRGGFNEVSDLLGKNNFHRVIQVAGAVDRRERRIENGDAVSSSKEEFGRHDREQNSN
jgi:hypothetical protein